VQVLVGSNGWAAKSAIHLLFEKGYVSNRDNLVVYSRTQRVFEISGVGSRTAREWIPRKEREKVENFFPFAFLTADKFSEMSEVEYREQNTKLINKAADYISLNKPSNCVLFSSGIVGPESLNLNRDRGYKVYRELKLLEEECIRKACHDAGTNLVVCRLFSASGRYLRDFRKYALGNLIWQAKFINKIVLTSTNAVWRRYIDMSQIIEICMLETRNCDFRVVESGGELIEIESLASKIAKIYNCKVINRNELHGEEDSYFSRLQDIEDLAARFGIGLFSIDEQINETIKGLEKSWSKGLIK